MGSPVVTLAWDIWLRNRTSIKVLIGILLFTSAYTAVMPDVRDSRADAGMLGFYVTVVALLLLLAIFGYTEFNPQRGTTGFPHRLFVLPVTTFKLVALPTILGVISVEVVVLAWTPFVMGAEDRSFWIAIGFGVFMVLYQTVLWTLPGLKSLRLLVIGLVGVFLIILRAFPFVQRLPDITVMGLLGGVALVAFLVSWTSVSRQRSGASWSLSSLNAFSLDRLRVTASGRPRSRIPFRSPHAAQFWLEWRRSGSVLPLLTGALLVLVIGPLSWFLRDDGPGSMNILLAVLAMPMILALAVGKAFSKPDFWSKELSVPEFIVVRPLASTDIVGIKLKVAAVSTAVSWLLVLAFVALWFPLSANLDSFAMVRGTLWMIHGHSVYPQYAIAVLLLIAGMLLTWRFMIGGLWLGLAGNSRVFAFSAAPYVILPLFVLPAILIMEQPILDWIAENTRRWLPPLVWIAAAGVVIKFWLAAFSWRRIEPDYVRRYLPVWLGGAVCLTVLAFLLGDLLSLFLPEDTYRLRNLLILIGLQIVPVARLGLAPAFLDKNRHR
jgi:hypothetical protein